MHKATPAFMLVGPLVFLQAAGAPPTPRSPVPASSLASRLPPPERLPACAKVKQVKTADEVPCGVTTNPIVTGDRAVVTCMADMALTQMAQDAGVKPEQVTEVALVVYDVGLAEIGVIALSFADAAAATAASKAFETTFGTEPRAAVFADGTTAGFMSCDPPVEDDCCRDVRALVLDSWKKAPTR